MAGPVHDPGGIPAGISIAVEHAGDATMWLTGRLCVADCAAVGAVLDRLLRDADCVTIDVGGLTVEQPAALDVLTTALLDAGGWPVAKLAVRGTDRAVLRALHLSGVSRSVAVAGSSAGARRACDRRPAQVRARQALPPEPESVQRARRFLEIRLALWAYPGATAPEAVQVVSELVTNAVEHAGTPLHVDVVLDDTALQCRVRDYSSELPILDEPCTRLQGGLGLHIVDGLATDWGCTPHPDGKTVWARFAAEPPLAG
ncbi:ATP-binding protein [Pseudonocardia humida]|uniref:ATP-binding protein n=1 Tax=Pseudonocardia humida TaxID=2800819 RepID=A0ABT0ZV34_9PSEU|nr:ATP-binding protein [Pseudonocardia humida]MCO1654601.1 ATP-binding protein [Pseudonocardia humida]